MTPQRRASEEAQGRWNDFKFAHEPSETTPKSGRMHRFARRRSIRRSLEQSDGELKAYCTKSIVPLHGVLIHLKADRRNAE
jgi:hypothetical protein